MNGVNWENDKEADDFIRAGLLLANQPVEEAAGAFGGRDRMPAITQQTYEATKKDGGLEKFRQFGCRGISRVGKSIDCDEKPAT